MTKARVHSPARSLLRSRPIVVAFLVSALALALCAWQMTVAGVVTGITAYDDGVYLGAAIRLVHGDLPYKDFVFVQPPGSVLLMSPIALLGRLVGDHNALILARALTVLVTAVNAGLVAWLVRARGRLAMVIAGVGLAVFPLAVAADHTLLLEPYLIFFVLLGALVAFQSETPTVPGLVLAGALFGAAASIRLWAVFPFLALVICLMPLWRTRVMPIVIGAALGFGVICLPFAIAAPHSFFHEVFVDQLSRGAPLTNPVSPLSRLLAITGLSGIAAVHASTSLALKFAGALALLVAVAFGIDRSGVHRVDEFVLLGAIATTGGMIAAPEFYLHYAYFTAPLIAALVAIAVTGGRRSLAELSRWLGLNRKIRHIAGVALLIGACSALVFVVVEDMSYVRAYLPSAAGNTAPGLINPGPAIDSAVPAGACVIADEPDLLIEANRLVSVVPNCPSLIDPEGLWLAEDGSRVPGALPPYSPDFVTSWQSAFENAQFVILSSPRSNRIPWTSELGSWFDSNYVRVLDEKGSYVYRHKAPTSK